MKNVHTHRNITWIDLQSPTRKEIQELSAKHKLPALVSNELFSKTRRPKVELGRGFIYLILHFPMLEGTRNIRAFEQEVDFVIKKNVIITTHYETIDSVHKFSKLFEVQSLVDKSDFGTHAGFVFFYLIRELYRAVGDQLEEIALELQNIEEEMFAGAERAMVEEISGMHKQLLTFKQSLRLHEEVLASLELAGKQFFGDKFTYHLHAIEGEYYKVANQLESQRETLNEMRETNNSLVSIKQNDVMKNLTVMAFIMLPLSLFAELFSMNTQSLPIVGAPGDFWIVIGLMGVFAALVFFYVKHKKWF